MVVPRFCLRARTLLTALVLASLLTWSVSRWRSAAPPALPRGSPASQNVSPDLTDAHKEFWRTFNRYLEKSAPGTAPIVEFEKAPTERFDPNDARPRPDYLSVEAEDVEAIKNAHTEFVAAITDASSTPVLPYVPGTKGVVSTAGGAYLPVLVISLRMLRRTGSTLPMEVFLADEEEYEEYICDVVLPALDARCVVLSRILAAAPAAIEKYQLKPFAMLFSSFEEILFLDADAFPLDKPETLFREDPFRAKGMVTWPDFWGSTVSSLFYEIVGTPAPPRTLRQSSESGEILLSKKTHARTLLLATYYNYYGPSHYYPLLSQGAAGEGDKETFLAAATAMQEPFYQVSEPIVALGHRKDKGGGFAGSAMAQFNPVQDYALIQAGKARVRGDDAPPPDVFVIHANFPKFNPATVFEKHEVNPTFTDDGAYTRAWTIPEEVVRRFSERGDVEMAFWKEVKWTACELEDKFVSWKGYTGICERVSDYWRNVFERKPLPT
ncbi:Alpha-mannosyltransferase [Penicillium canariense]|uniref:Alpha-mannosyltransferase n=1 Tax=Penicillium canariense TaxID=189055 RepID=A0A9W9I4A0_9EURO|nr:Alpha-mannosyltransferase [Penicillium canariense]KAJ5166378.1 Alpha-mannosyltransferase [Penicillium canariense]